MGVLFIVTTTAHPQSISRWSFWARSVRWCDERGGSAYRNDDGPIPGSYLSGPVGPVVLGGVMEGGGVLFIVTTTAPSPEHILVVLLGPWC